MQMALDVLAFTRNGSMYDVRLASSIGWKKVLRPDRRGSAARSLKPLTPLRVPK
jgi:hypothetical protein